MTASVLATLSIGSNENPQRNVPISLQRLQTRFGDLHQSPWYESDAVGFEGDHFINLVVAFQTRLPPERINATLKQIENELGRDRSKARFSSRPIDLDLLTWGDHIDPAQDLPRAEILTQAFVLKPLADLLPRQNHPETGETFITLWQRMASKHHSLREIPPPSDNRQGSPE